MEINLKIIKQSPLLLWTLLLFSNLHLNAQNLDIDLLRKINLERNTALDPTFKFVT
ncbi:MAG: hypothetical protein RI948_282, partial [Bacteroidota bacterium]